LCGLPPPPPPKKKGVADAEVKTSQFRLTGTQPPLGGKPDEPINH